jgi:ribose 5-phosphate isomerase B
MKIAIGCDHGGFALKPIVIEELKKLDHAAIDCGARTLDPSDDYPDFAQKVAEAVASGQADRGIILCGSGVGACVAANKVPGVRAAICHDSYSAHQGVEHDDLNVLCLGARIIGSALASELVQAFLNAQFSGEERHRRRLEKVLVIERHYQRDSRAKEGERGGKSLAGTAKARSERLVR